MTVDELTGDPRGAVGELGDGDLTLISCGGRIVASLRTAADDETGDHYEQLAALAGDTGKVAVQLAHTGQHQVVMDEDERVAVLGPPTELERAVAAAFQ